MPLRCGLIVFYSCLFGLNHSRPQASIHAKTVDIAPPPYDMVNGHIIRKVSDRNVMVRKQRPIFSPHWLVVVTRAYDMVVCYGELELSHIRRVQLSHNTINKCHYAKRGFPLLPKDFKCFGWSSCIFGTLFVSTYNFFYKMAFNFFFLKNLFLFWCLVVILKMSKHFMLFDLHEKLLINKHFHS